ncbi:MAG TPA: hypothetical protein VG714_03610 [Acidobacteriaceae bacterium]|nr:hypothetical protein [Acidobacteriaceae bacterium]
MATLPAFAARKPKEPRVRENVEWLWQYTPDQTHPDGRENALAEDLRFFPMLQQYLTAPQHFWGQPIAGRWRSLANTALDHLTVPDKVITDQNRYISITGCTVHFCPARGLLWVDLNGSHHLVVFAAIDWTKQGAPTTDPDAEYNLWVFSNDPLASDKAQPASGAPSAASSTATADLHLPPALTHAIGRWTAEPLAGSHIVQRITHAFIVDPDGTEHEVPPSALGVKPIMHTVPTGNGPAPDTNTKPGADDSTPILRPRN